MKIQPLAGPPGKPLVVNTTSNSVDLTWKKPQENPDNIDGYKVLYRSKDDPLNSEWKSQQTNGVVEQITISGLVPENLYYFKVQAVYNNVEGETSIISEANTRRISSNPGYSQHNVDASPNQATPLSASTSKALPAPGQPKVVTITHNSIKLTWKEPKPCDENVEHYTVSCFCLDDDDNSDDDDDDEKPKCKPFETINNESTIVISGLVQNTNYQFNVKAQYKTGLSKNSKKSAVIKTERLLLVSPGQPRAVNITHNSIELTWKEPKPCGENIECYIVSCFCLDNDDENDDDTIKRKPLEIMSNENTIVIPGLVHDTNYKFNVKAQYKTGFSNTSRMSEAIKTQLLVLLAPGQPKAVNITHNSIELTWKKPKPCGLGIERYIVSCFCLDNDDNDDDDNDDDIDDDEPQCQSFETKHDENTILITGLINDTNYQFSVNAQYKTGHSKNSKMSTVIKTHPQVLVAGPPGKPSVVNTTSNSIDLAWEKPQENPDIMDGYKVLYCSKDDPPNSKWKSQHTNGVVEQITISGLVPEKTYYFKVQAVCNKVEGETSIVTEAIIKHKLFSLEEGWHKLNIPPYEAPHLSANTSKALPSPSQPKGVDITHNSIKLTWKEPKPCGEQIECYIVSCFNLDDNDNDDDDDDNNDEPRCMLFNTKNDENIIFITGLAQDTNYQFSVKAQYRSGLSKNSRKSTVIKTQRLLPVEPGKPKAVNITYNSIKLTWKEPEPCGENVECYIVSCFCLDSNDDDDDEDEKPQSKSFQTKNDEKAIVITGLVDDTHYQFSVKAQYKTGHSKNSKKSTVIKTHPQVLVAGPPGKPSVVNIINNSIDLKWDKPKENPDNIDGYKVLYRSKDDPPNSEWKSQQTNGVVERITISGLVPRNQYYFKVQAVYNNVEGEPSTVSEAIIKSGLSSPGKSQHILPHKATQLSSTPKPLPAPTQPIPVNITHNSIELTWKLPKSCSDSIEYYIVSCFCLDNDDNDDEDDDNDKPQCETKITEETIVIPGLAQDTNYQFSVKAQYKTGLSKNSKKSTVIKTQRLLLVEPGKPKAANITHNSIKLTWNEPEPCGENVECYIVSFFCLDSNDDDDDEDEKPRSKSFQTVNDENAIVITGLVDDTNYQFNVKAQYKTGISKTSKKSTVIKTHPQVLVAGPPCKPVVVNTTSNSVDLKWKKPQTYPGNIDQYKVLYRSKDDPPNSEWKSQQTNGVVEQITISGLVPENQYYFKVQAVYNNAEGETSKVSEAINTKYILPSPGKPTASQITHDSLKLHWSEPTKSPFKHYDKLQCYKILSKTLHHDSRDIWESWVIEGTITNATIHGLSPATEYIFKVQAGSSDHYFGKESSESEVIATKHITPGRPGKPHCVNIGDSFVQLQWTKPIEHAETVEHYVVSYSSLDEQIRQWKQITSVSEEIIVSQLSPNTRYSFKIQAISNSISGKESETSNVIQTLVPIPSKPGQPKAVSVTYTSVSLKWAKPKQHSEYVMKYCVKCSSEGKQSEEWYSLQLTGTREHVVVNRLCPNTTYLFKVQAISKNGSSEMSEVSKPICTPSPVPSQTGQPILSDATHDKITITWGKPRENAEYIQSYAIHYKSLQKSNRHGWTTVKTENAVEALVISGLEINTSYVFKVQAESPYGSSKESEPSTPLQTLFPIPSKPGQFEAVSVTHNNVSLKWTKPTEYAEYVMNYCVRYCPQEEQSKETVVRVGKEHVTISELLPDTTYVFTVQAQNKTGSSELNEISVRTPPPVPSQPGQPQAVNISHDKITITWAKPQLHAERVQYYTIHYKSLQKSCKQEWTTVKTENAVEVFEVNGLEVNTDYIFIVRAESVDGYSDESKVSNQIATRSPVPSQPGKPACKAKAHDRITLSWSRPTEYFENIECYEILFYDNDKERKTVTNGCVEEMVINGLNPQQSYKFVVRAKSKFGDSQNSLSSDRISTNPDRPVLKIIQHCKKLQDTPTIYHLSMMKSATIEEKMYAKFEYGKASYGIKNKVLMVVGATGSGKSTLINGMVNYLLGVQLNDEFRLKLIHEEVESQTKSVTKWISAYTFHKQDDFSLPYSLTIVDTPGFGDTEGIARDREITSQIKEFFSLPGERGIDHLDGIGFVTQGGQPRLTQTQIYIFDSVFSIFGNDVKDNIFTMVTFADSADPPVIGAITKAGIPCTTHFQFNNSALYTTKRDTFAKMFWEMGSTSFSEFFDKFGKSQAVSLKLTREVLDNREQLETTIIGLQQQIHDGMSMIDSLQQQQQILKQNEFRIKANEKFEYVVYEDKTCKYDLPQGEHVTNCLKCNKTCHRNCKIPNDGDKYRCAAMKDRQDKNTTCTICVGKCAWQQHHNATYYFGTVKTPATKCYENIKKMYHKALGGKTEVESIIANMESEIQCHFQIILVNIQEVHSCIKRLDEIAFKPHPLSDVGYIDLLIESEKQGQKPGFRKRIQYYSEVRKQAELIGKAKQVPQQLSQAQQKEWWKQLLSLQSDELAATLPPLQFKPKKK